MAEATSNLTFGDLILEAALEMGVAYYGSDGTEIAQVPVDTHDLAEAKRHVNNALRMVYHSAPAGGWRWQRPKIAVDVWPTVAEAATLTISGGTHDVSNDETTLTASAATFYESMEGKSIVIDGVGTFTMKTYTSTTVMVVEGDASAASADVFSITADGDYTMPSSFNGTFTGAITYAAATNQAIHLEWSDPSVIRQLREDVLDTNYPSLAAIRPRTNTRRSELMVWPVPSTAAVLEFPAFVQFDLLTAVTDKPALPPGYDELLRAAVLYVIERDVHKQDRGQYKSYFFEAALPSAWELDKRAAPRRLGYFGNPPTPGITPFNFRDFRRRPAVNTDNI